RSAWGGAATRRRRRRWRRSWERDLSRVGTSHPVRERARVSDLAATDNHSALKIARGIEDPWYRCQSLACVARFAPHGKLDDRIEEALAACFSAAHAYQCLAVAA